MNYCIYKFAKIKEKNKRKEKLLNWGVVDKIFGDKIPHGVHENERRHIFPLNQSKRPGPYSIADARYKMATVSRNKSSRTSIPILIQDGMSHRFLINCKS